MKCDNFIEKVMSEPETEGQSVTDAKAHLPLCSYEKGWRKCAWQCKGQLAVTVEESVMKSREWESRMLDKRVSAKMTLNRNSQSFQQFLLQQMNMLKWLLLWGNENQYVPSCPPQFMLTASQCAQPAAQQIYWCFFFLQWCLAQWIWPVLLGQQGKSSLAQI